MASRIPGGGVDPTNLPPGVGLGSGIPRGRMSPNGASENTGNIIGSILSGMMNAGGQHPRGPRGPEKPSPARSAAISRRLNGNPSRGKELKGL